MSMTGISPHWKRFLRFSIWVLCMALSTAVAGFYGGARWAAITPALWMPVFVPMVLLPLKPARRS
jgi:hypothetical protein